MKVAALLGDPTFEIVSSVPRRRPLVPTYFDTLPPRIRERAVWLEAHVTEVLDGIPIAEGGTGAAPRPEYDVTCTTLRQRELAKIGELARSDHPMSLQVFQRYRRRYAATGLEALIDKRPVRRTSPTGRVDDRYVDALRHALAENTTDSTGTATRLKRAVDRAVRAEHGDDIVRIPSQQTFNRLLGRLREARHATGSARTRRTLARQPGAPFGTVVATRPGEWMQIDSTPFDVAVRLDDEVSGRVELTGLVDVATRTIAAAVLRPTTRAVDASLLLARAMTPEPMRPGWPQAVSMAYSALPYRVMRRVDDRLDNAAARPVIVPETIVYDHGSVYVSTTFRSACRTFGINAQPAHEDTPTDKPIIERTLGSVKTLFAQYVTGYLGTSVEQRGTDADQRAVFSLIELQDLLDEWIVTHWQNRPHDGLRDPMNPQRVLTPNEKYAALLTVAGYVPVPLSPEDYIALLPSTSRVINSYGIKINHRVYDSDELNPYRGQLSGPTALGARWEVHYDPYDVTRIWVRNHRDGGFLLAYWRQLHTMSQPFGDAAWEHARKIVAERGDVMPSEDTIKAAVDDLLDRAGPTPPPPPRTTRRTKTAQDKRVAARTRAVTAPSAPIPEIPPPAATMFAPEDNEDISDIIPLPVFDAEKESRTWW
ncbi:Mu transposase C-terminal domain-containing protein [Rhodococcus pyridinivorans]|uniref:Mu transposase C-terminal domain-containing protein n=1 Tax=Rhodococcus pyridinivorans TaxID=103816 RepID=UPI001E4108E3|nr:Mu transposase C-terminal domain-containing protein [Rhodococcus pyridinivorans]